jgi:hypothetical protein
MREEPMFLLNYVDSIPFRQNFWHPPLVHSFRKGHAKFFWRWIYAMVLTLFCLFYIVQATMVIKMYESMVNTYLQSTTADMLKNNEKEIRCPCRRCKLEVLVDPFSGKLMEHLLMHGFMDGYTESPAHEDINGMTGGNVEEGHRDNSDDERNDKESPGHDEEEEAGNDEEEEGEAQNPLTSVVRDPHVQELILSKSSNTAREKAKLDRATGDRCEYSIVCRMRSRGDSLESNAHGSVYEAKTQMDGRKLERLHAVLA